MNSMDNFFSPERHWEIPEVKTHAFKRLVPLLVLSIGLHIAVVIALSRTATPTPIQTKKTQPIYAQLIIPPPVKTAPPREEVKPDETPQAPPTVAQEPVPSIQEQNTQEQDNNDMTPPPTTTPEPTQKPDVADAVQPAIDTTPPALTGKELTQDKTDTATRPKIDISRTQLDRFFSSQRADQQQILAEEAAKAYQRQQVSPDLSAGYVSQEERNKPKPVKVNCSTNVNKSMAIVSGLLGGNLTCTDRSQFNQFIEDRKNKQ